MLHEKEEHKSRMQKEFEKNIISHINRTGKVGWVNLNDQQVFNNAAQEIHERKMIAQYQKEQEEKIKRELEEEIKNELRKKELIFLSVKEINRKECLVFEVKNLDESISINDVCKIYFGKRGKKIGLFSKILIVIFFFTLTIKIQKNNKEIKKTYIPKQVWASLDDMEKIYKNKFYRFLFYILRAEAEVIISE